MGDQFPFGDFLIFDKCPQQPNTGLIFIYDIASLKARVNNLIDQENVILNYLIKGMERKLSDIHSFNLFVSQHIRVFDLVDDFFLSYIEKYSFSEICDNFDQMSRNITEAPSKKLQIAYLLSIAFPIREPQDRFKELRVFLNPLFEFVCGWICFNYTVKNNKFGNIFKNISLFPILIFNILSLLIHNNSLTSCILVIVLYLITYLYLNISIHDNGATFFTVFGNISSTFSNETNSTVVLSFPSSPFNEEDNISLYLSLFVTSIAIIRSFHFITKLIESLIKK